MVVAFHAGLPVPGGFVGVDVFFVISGFVITAMLHREWHQTGHIRFGRFYLRRFKRLTPALALTVAVTMLISIVVLSPFGTQQTAAKTAIGAMLLAANFVIARTTGGYFDAPAETNPLLNTWSLSVEEQFYLVFPALIALGWMLARRRGLLRFSPIVIVASVAIASFALAVAGSIGLTFRGSGTILGFYSPFTRAWEFAVGALLALALASRAPRAPRTSATLGVIGLGMLTASLWLITGTTPFPGIWTLLPVTGALLLLLAGTDPNAPSTRLLATMPMARVGDWSYSIYLWHWPFVVFAAAIWPDASVAVLVGAAVSLAPALMSYRWLEQPIRTMPVRSRRQLVALVGATVGIPLACAALVGLGARAAWWMEWPSNLVGQDNHVAYEHCTDQPFDPGKCTWNQGLTGGQVLLAGDSQAYAAADGVIEAAQSLGMSTVVSSRSGCPVSSLDTTGDKPYDCPSWQRQVLDFALSTKPRAVVIANRSTGYTNSGWRTTISEDGAVANSTNAVSLYAAGLTDAVRELRAAGIPVIILQNIPEPDQVEAQPSLFRRAFPPTTSSAFDPADTLARRAPVALVEGSIAGEHPGTVVVDPVKVLCQTDACPMERDGEPIYLDPLHLTREGSLLLSPTLADAISQVSR
jgi:peptidoglycan/LPS O-acetylase OafA/YrhL